MLVKKGVTKVEFTEDDVKDIVAKYLRENGYEVNNSDITISVGTHLVGFLTDEHQEPYFKGITAVVK